MFGYSVFLLEFRVYCRLDMSKHVLEIFWIEVLCLEQEPSPEYSLTGLNTSAPALKLYFTCDARTKNSSACLGKPCLRI